MPTSSGHDRANYSTTFGFSKGAYARSNKNNLIASLYNDNMPQANKSASQLGPIKNYNQNGAPKMTKTTMKKSPQVRQLSLEKKPATPPPSKPNQQPPRRTQSYGDDIGSSGNYRDYSTSRESTRRETPYVKIPDPDLREMVEELIKSEQDTASADPNLITQIDHKGYSLFLSKNGVNPFKTDLNRGNRSQAPPPPPTQRYENDYPAPPVVTNVNRPPPQHLAPILKKQPITTNNGYYRSTESPGVLHYEYQDVNGDNYEIREISSRNNSEITSRIHFDESNDIPVEVTRLIQQDMAQNPGGDEERNYRIVINRNSKSKMPHTIRVKARSMNGKKILEYIPEIDADVVRKVPNKQQTIQVQQMPDNNKYQQQPQMVDQSGNNYQFSAPFNPTQSPQYILKPHQTQTYVPTAQIQPTTAGNNQQQTIYYNEQSSYNNMPVQVRAISPNSYANNNNPYNSSQSSYAPSNYNNYQPQQIQQSRPKQYFGNVNED